MPEAPAFDPSKPFEDVGAGAPPAFDPSQPFEEVAASPSRKSSAPQWMKSVGAGADKLARTFPLSAPFTAPIAAMPETYDIAAEGIKSLGDPANPFTEEREAIKREAMKSGPVLSGASEGDAERIADRQIANRRRQEALGTPLKALSVLASPLQGMLRHYGSQPLEDVGGPPKEVTEGFAGIGAAAAGLRPGMNPIRKSFGLPLEGEVLPPQGGPRGGGPGIAPGGEGPSAGLRDWLDQPLQSPMTPREGTNARLLPHDYEGSGTAGDPHYDAAWEALGSRGSMGAAGRPGGPLADMDPAAIEYMRKAVRDHGYTPWEIERLQEENSTHHFLGEMSPSLRKKMGGLNALGGEPGNTIEGSFRQRGREEPERVSAIFDRGFGPAINVRERKAALSKEQQEKSGQFWKEFERTPIPPTPELAAIEDALHAAGAWSAAETSLRIRRVPRHNQFVELPNTGEHVLANPQLPSETTRVPTAAFYQAAKGRLDASIATALKNEDADRVRELVGLKHALTDAIDNHPDPTVAGTWRQARETWAGPEQLKTAMDLGQRILTNHIDSDLLVELWGTLSEPERVAAMQGARKYLKTKLGGRGGELATMKDVLTPNNQEKLQTMLGADEADRMIADLFHEKNMHESPNRIIYNSVTGERTAAQAEFKPQERWWQSGSRGDIPTSKTGAVFKAADAALSRMQKRSIEEAQKKQDKINSDIARIMTLQGPERNAALRYLHGVNPEEPSAGAGPRPSPRPAPARPAGDVEPPPPSQVPEGPPGYPQPEMTAVEATQVLRDFGYDQATINRMGGATRMATAQHLQASYPKGPPAKTPDFPGDVTPREPAPPAAAARVAEPSVPAETPLSLVEWIRKQGGISPSDKFAPEIKGIFGGNRGAIVRTGGKSLENLLKAAKADKYLFDPSDVTGAESTVGLPEFLDLIQRDFQTKDKVYPASSEVKQSRNKDLEAVDREQKRDLEFSPEARRLDRELAQHGVTRDMMPTDVRQRAVDMLRSGIERDPVEAFEKAMNEKLQGDLEADRAAEIGEGLEPSPQSHGMAARGNRAAPQGQSGAGQDVRGAGARNRAEKDTLARKTLAKRMVSIYNAPDKGPRHFGEDYRGAIANDSQAGATLSHAISGEPLTAPHVAGRRRVGGFDEPISPADYETLTKTATGRSTQYLHPSEMGGDAGQVELHPLTRRVERVNIDKTLSPEKMAMVRAHELGHVVDQMAGEIPVTGLAGELQGIYNTLNNGQRAKGGLEAAAWGKPMTPKGMGYKGVQVAREYMAEAIRAYMTNPNYLKSVAPRVAARIREYVNSHPELSKIIQFNMLALGMLPWESIGKALPFATGGAVNRATGGRVDASTINSNPTEAQKEAGNYAKDHIKIHGLDITIENAKGSKRSGVDKGGKPWSVALPAHYGYIKGSVGADKDHVDCYIGPHIKASKVYVIDQKDEQTGKFDEHKCFIGFASAKHARNCYLKAFSDGKGADRLGAMHEADIDGFKAWLAAGDTTKPIGKIAA